MATAAEQTFVAAVRTAEGVRQSAKAAAFATFVAASFAGTALAAYIASLQAADNAYITSVNSAAQTLGVAGYTIPNGPGTNASPLPNPGNVAPSFASSMPTMSGLGNGTATMGATI